MMWNYRVIKKKDKALDHCFFGIHEVYYDKSGKIQGWTEDSMSPFGESKEELKEELMCFLQACKLPVLEIQTKNETKIIVEI